MVQREVDILVAGDCDSIADLAVTARVGGGRELSAVLGW